MNVKNLLLAITGGVAVTILTGLIHNPNPMLIGATYYGYPFAWLIRFIIAPQYFPWRIDVVNLVADIVVWIVIIGIVLSVLTRVKKGAGH
jgi:hypothetical protein